MKVGRTEMGDGLLIQIVAMLLTAGAIYGSIKAAIERAIATAEAASKAAKRAHKRIDKHLIRAGAKKCG